MASTGGALPMTRDWVSVVLLATGWQRVALAAGAGVLAVLALPPLDLLPAYALAFPLLVLLIDGVHAEGRAFARSLRDAALVGWGFGFGYFVGGLWWLGVAFVAGGDHFVPLIPLGVIGLPAFLALFPAFGLALARLFWHAGSTRVLLLAVGLGVSEWLRGVLFTGFPWNGFGQAFANHVILAQGAALVGAEALGVIAVALFATPALLVTGRGLAGRLAGPALAVSTLAALAAYGMTRLEPVGGSRIDFTRLALVPGVKLRIMQPNIAQDAKLALPDAEETLKRYFALSDRAKGAHASGVQDVTHLIWPESPFPFVLERHPDALDAIRRFLPQGTVLLTGAVRAEAHEDAGKRYRYFNAMNAIDRTGIVARYDKVHLVPFGEFLPFEGLLRRLGLREFVREVGGFTAGSSRGTLTIPGLPPVTALICFESIFSSEASPASAGPGVFVNITNDAWFGATPGPYQHLAQARLRAIEYGLPLVRAANSGVSAIFDPYGRAVATLPLETADVLDAPLPAALEPTFYRSRQWFGFAAIMICLAVLGLFGRKWQKS